MDLSSSHQVSSGPMTRARARALETDVTSLLSHFHFDAHETWLLPQMETLCILRYQVASHGEAKEQEGSEAEDMHVDGEEISQVPGWPDDSDTARTIRISGEPREPEAAPRGRIIRTSPGSSGPQPDVRTRAANDAARLFASSRPHPGPSGSLKPGSSGCPSGSSGPPLACACWAEAHVPLHPICQYKRPLHHFSRVSKGLAHVCVRALLIHLVPFSSEIAPPRRRSFQADSRPHHGKNLKTSRRRSCYLYRP